MTGLPHSEVFIREDLAAILRAIALTADVTTGRSHSPHDAAFRRGFAVAIAAVATAVHIEAHELRLPAGARGDVWRRP